MNRSIHKIIDEQIKQWELSKTRLPEEIQTCRVITISRECGSQGQKVGEKLAAALGFDLFHHQILEAMIETSKSSRILLESLDEKAMNVVDDIVSNFVSDHHLWPDEYSKLLLRILNTIGKHGNAVILGRGANFALEKTHALKIRIVGPERVRLRHIQETWDLNYEDALKKMNSTDADRIAFVKRYFNSNVENPAIMISSSTPAPSPWIKPWILSSAPLDNLLAPQQSLAEEFSSLQKSGHRQRASKRKK